MESTPRQVQDLSRFRLPAGFRGRSAVVCQGWWIVQATLFAWSPQFLYGFRRFLLRLFGCRVGKSVLIRSSARVTFPWKVTIGDRSWIGDHAELYSLGAITIGSDVVISQKSYLCGGTHDPSRIDFPVVAQPITVEDQAWVCADVFVMPGITIGRGAIVAARALVTRDVPPFTRVQGSPAKAAGIRHSLGE